MECAAEVEAVKRLAAEERTEREKQLICPYCNTRTMRRNLRQGFLEEVILPRFGYYPWECSECRETTLFRVRNLSRRTRQS